MSKMFRRGNDSSGNAGMLDTLLQKRESELRAAFEVFDPARTGRVSLRQLENAMTSLGLDPKRPDIQRELKSLDTTGSGALSFQDFYKLMSDADNNSIVFRALSGKLAIPNFQEFCDELVTIFESCRDKTDGKNADYIPLLDEDHVDPKHFGIAICTVDGQQFEYGDSRVEYCVQSTVKPLIYTLACDERGIEKVHQHVGFEPSGVEFNAFTLNKQGKPHNPFVNSGAITICSLMQPKAGAADRFSYVLGKLSDMAGGSKIGFNQPVYLSEAATADRNKALSYFMNGHRVFEKDAKIDSFLDFYFQCCSIEIDCVRQAAIAATLANGGVSTLSNKPVISSDIVRNCLALMYSCGMYDYSGEWAFSVGLPAKSGVSGAIMCVIPNVMGLTIWSPRLDSRGNSVRGIEFCKKLTNKFNFSIFDQLVKGTSSKRDPTIANEENGVNVVQTNGISENEEENDESVPDVPYVRASQDRFRKESSVEYHPSRPAGVSPHVGNSRQSFGGMSDSRRSPANN